MGDYLLSQRGQLSLAIVLWVGAMSTSDRKEEVGLSVLTWETLSVEMPVFCLCSYDFTCQTYQLNTANNPCVLRRSKKWVSHPRALQPGILLCIYCEIDVCYATVYFTCQTYQLNTANNPCVLRRSKKWVSHPRDTALYILRNRCLLCHSIRLYVSNIPT